MAPQRLDIGDLEARRSHLVQYQRYVRHLAVREHVAVDEFPRAQPDPAAVGIARGDAVVQYQPVLGEQRADFLEVTLQMPESDVLEHADARDLVVDPLTRDFAVVLEPHFAAALQSLLADAPGRELELIVAERHAGRACPELLRRAHDERAPAAANVEK